MARTERGEALERSFTAPARRVELLESKFACLMWYSFAVHEAPSYTAEAFNPDIHECQWLGMQPDPDPVHIASVFVDRVVAV